LRFTRGATMKKGYRYVRDQMHTVMFVLAHVGLPRKRCYAGGYHYRLQRISEYRWSDLKPWINRQEIPDAYLSDPMVYTVSVAVNTCRFSRLRIWLASR